jgi:hypothetical protein
MEMTGAAQRHVQIEALKALVNLVEVDEATFRLLLRSHEKPTVVVGKAGIFWFKKHTYMTSYDGFVFLLRADGSCDFKADAPDAFVVDAKTVHIPFL